MATIPAARDLAVLSLDTLLVEAAAVRDEVYGRRVTWSPKVAIPLTSLCQDPCGYCHSTAADTRGRGVSRFRADPGHRPPGSGSRLP